MVFSYHFLRDQYLAVSLLGGLVSHLCLALKLLRRFGWSFLIDMFGSPYLISLTLSPCFASTANFLDLPGRLRSFIISGEPLASVVDCRVSSL